MGIENNSNGVDVVFKVGGDFKALKDASKKALQDMQTQIDGDKLTISNVEITGGKDGFMKFLKDMQKIGLSNPINITANTDSARSKIEELNKIVGKSDAKLKGYLTSSLNTIPNNVSSKFAKLKSDSEKQIEATKKIRELYSEINLLNAKDKANTINSDDITRRVKAYKELESVMKHADSSGLKMPKLKGLEIDKITKDFENNLNEYSDKFRNSINSELKTLQSGSIDAMKIIEEFMAYVGSGSIGTATKKANESSVAEFKAVSKEVDELTSKLKELKKASENPVKVSKGDIEKAYKDLNIMKLPKDKDFQNFAEKYKNYISNGGNPKDISENARNIYDVDIKDYYKKFYVDPAKLKPVTTEIKEIEKALETATVKYKSLEQAVNSSDLNPGTTDVTPTSSPTGSVVADHSKEIDMLNTKLAETVEKNKAIEASLREQTSIINSMKEHQALLSSTASPHIMESEDYQSLVNQLESAEKENFSLKEMASYSEKEEEILRKRISVLSSGDTVPREDYDTASRVINQYYTEIQKLETIVESTNAKINELKQNVENLSNENILLSDDKKNLSDELSEQKELNTEVSKYKAEIESNNLAIQKMSDELKEAHAEADALMNVYKGLSTVLDECLININKFGLMKNLPAFKTAVDKQIKAAKTNPEAYDKAAIYYSRYLRAGGTEKAMNGDEDISSKLLERSKQFKLASQEELDAALNAYNKKSGLIQIDEKELENLKEKNALLKKNLEDTNLTIKANEEILALIKSQTNIQSGENTAQSKTKQKSKLKADIGTSGTPEEVKKVTAADLKQDYEKKRQEKSGSITSNGSNVQVEVEPKIDPIEFIKKVQTSINGHKVNVEVSTDNDTKVSTGKPKASVKSTNSEPKVVVPVAVIDSKEEVINKETDAYNRNKESVLSLISVIERKSTAITQSKIAMEVAAKSELSSVQSILESVEKLSSSISSIPAISLNAENFNKLITAAENISNNYVPIEKASEEWNQAYLNAKKYNSELSENVNITKKLRVGADGKSKVSYQVSDNKGKSLNISSNGKLISETEKIKDGATQAKALSKDWDKAIIENQKRTEKFSSDWDKAIYENNVRNAQSTEKFSKDWEKAIIENNNRLKKSSDVQKNISQKRDKETYDANVKEMQKLKAIQQSRDYDTYNANASQKKKLQTSAYSDLTKATQNYIYWAKQEILTTGSAKDKVSEYKIEAQKLMNVISGKISSNNLTDTSKETAQSEKLAIAEKEITVALLKKNEALKAKPTSSKKEISDEVKLKAIYDSEIKAIKEIKSLRAKSQSGEETSLSEAKYIQELKANIVKHEKEILDYKKKGIKVTQKEVELENTRRSKQISNNTNTASSRSQKYKKYSSINASDFINEADIVNAQKNINSLFNKMNSGAKLTKSEISKLNDEFDEQVRIIQKSTVATNKLYSKQNGGSYVGQLSSLNISSAEDIINQKGAIQKFLSSINTGKVVLGEFTDDYQKLGYTVIDENKNIKNMSATFDLANNSIRNTYKSETEYLSKSAQWVDGFKKKIRMLTQYITGISLIMTLWTKFTQGIAIIREFDLAMTELNKVSSETEETLKKFGQTAFDIGRKVGSTGTEIVKSTAAWKKLGYSIKEAGELAQASALYSNVGDMEIDEATEHMVSTMKAFNVEAGNSTSIVDKFNQIGNNFAISSSNIGVAMERSAAALVAAGNDIDQSIALITAGNIIPQDAETVGNTLKVVALRVRGAKTELADMGEETDGLATSTSKLREEMKALTGVDIMESDGKTFKSTYQQLLEISKVWDKLTDVSQANVLEKIAGKTRSSVVAGLLSNMSTAEDVLLSSQNSEGSANEENLKYMDSIQGKIDVMNNSWQEMWTSAISSDFVKFILEVGTGLIDIVKNVGLLKTLIIGVTTYVSASKLGNLSGLVGSTIGGTSIKGWTESFKRATNDPSLMSEFNKVLSTSDERLVEFFDDVKNGKRNLSDLSAYSKEAGISTKAMGVSFSKSGMAAKASAVGIKILKTALNTLAIFAVIQGITMLVEVFDEAHVSASEMSESVDTLMDSFESNISTLKSNKKTLESLTESYSDLSKGVDRLGENVGLTSAEYSEYNSIVNEIADMFPNLVTGYTSQGNAILSVKGNVEELTQAYKDANDEAYKTILNNDDVVDNYKNKVDKVENYGKYVFTNGKDDSVKNKRKQLEFFMNASYEEAVQPYNASGGYINSLGLNKKTTEKEFEELRSVFKMELSKLNSVVDSEIKNIKNVASAYLYTSEDYENLSEEGKAIASKIINGMNEELADSFENSLDISYYVQSLIDAIKNDSEGQNVLSALFSLDMNSMPVEESKRLVNKYIDYLATILNEDPIVLKTKLGFEDVDTTYNAYKKVLTEAAEKFSGSPHEASTQSYNNEYSSLDKFANENNVNTQAKIDLLKELIETSATAKEAQDKYLASDTATAFSFGATLDNFQSNIDSLKGSLTTLFSGNYTSSDLLSALTTIESTIENMDVDATIDWESITSIDDLKGEVDKITDIYVADLLSSLNVDASSAVGTLMKSIVQNAYNAEMAITNLTSSVDTLQGSYDSLKNIISEYNAYGYISLDNVQSLLELSPEYLSCLENENGQLSLNKESIRELINQRIADAKAAALSKAITSMNDLAIQKETSARYQSAIASQYAEYLLNNYNVSVDESIIKVATLTAEYDELYASMGVAFDNGASDKDVQKVLDNLSMELDLIDSTYSGSIEGLMSTASTAAENAADEYLELYEAERKNLDRLHDAGAISEKKYVDELLALNIKYFKDKEKYAEKYYENEQEWYQATLTLYDRIIDTVISVADDKIDALNKEKDAFEKIQQVKIDAIQSEIDAMEKANEEREESLALQKAQYNYNKSLNQRTELAYVNGQMVYQTNAEDISSAKQELDDLKYSATIKDMEDKITSLEKTIDQVSNSIDSQIEVLEAYKEKWSDISSSYQKQQDLLLVQEYFGLDAEAMILTQRQDKVESFKNSYIQAQVDMANAAVLSANKIVEANKNISTSTTTSNVTNSAKTKKEDEKKTFTHGVRNSRGQIVKEFNSLDQAKGWVAQNGLSYKQVSGMTVSAYSKGGYIKGNEDLSPIANLIGEDTLVAANHGEAIFTAEQTKAIVDTEKQLPQLVEEVKEIPNIIRIELQDTWKNFAESMMVNKINQSILPNFSSVPNLNNVPVVNNNHSVVQHITLSCPNITDNSKANDLFKEFENLSQAGIQYFNKK